MSGIFQQSPEGGSLGIFQKLLFYDLTGPREKQNCAAGMKTWPAHTQTSVW